MPSPYSRIHRLRKGEKRELTIFLNLRIFESRRPHSIQAGILYGEFLFRPMVALNINLDHWKLHTSSNPHLNLASKQQNASINRAAFIIMRTLVFECQHDNKYTNKASVFRKTTDVGQQICLSSSRSQEPRAKWTCQACKQRRWWYSRVLELFHAIARQECFDKADLSFCKEMLPFGVHLIKRVPLRPGLDTMATILGIATQRSKRSQWSLPSMISKWSQGSQDGGLHDRSDLWAYGFRTIATIIAIVVPRSLRSYGNQP